ncbi:MAG: RsmE family RNA methyltransferase, partial [Cyclobacteriaceae bacterium]
KNQDRVEWLVEKAVEIGIDELSFFTCQHSERKKLNLERLEKKAIAAMKQSVKARLPQINPIINFKELTKQVPAEYEKFIACVPANEQQLKNLIPLQKRYCLLIGPEGGFSKKEVSQAEGAGFKVVSLGNNRLRTETAALIGCHTFHLING